MTEKRFKHHMGLICEKRDGEYYSFTIREVCDLLNDFHEEITKLNETIKTMDQTKHTTSNDAIIKRIVKCYLTFEKEAPAKTILEHIDNTEYGLRRLKGPSYLTKQLKKWKHDDKYLNNLKWYVNNRKITVFYLDKK